MSIPRQLPLKKIRENCLECSGNQYSGVRLCHLTDCPLWYLRFGRMPKTIIKKGGRDEEDLFNPENFQEDGKFGQDQDTTPLATKNTARSEEKS